MYTRADSQVNKKHSLRESWWYKGFEDNGGVKKEGNTGLIIRENEIVLYLAHD